MESFLEAIHLAQEEGIEKPLPNTILRWSMLDCRIKYWSGNYRSNSNAFSYFSNRLCVARTPLSMRQKLIE